VVWISHLHNLRRHQFCGHTGFVDPLEVSDFECFVDFRGVDSGDTLAINVVFESFEDGLVVFERSIASTGSLDQAVLAVDGLVVVGAIKKQRANVLMEGVRYQTPVRRGPLLVFEWDVVS